MSGTGLAGPAVLQQLLGQPNQCPTSTHFRQQRDKQTNEQTNRTSPSHKAIAVRLNNGTVYATDSKL